MARLILLIILVLLVTIGGIAVLLYHFFGWTGLLLFPVVLLALAWLMMKVIGRVIKRLLLIPFKAKAAVLHNARLEVHSVRPVAVARRMEDVDDEADKEMKHYYEMDVTITPADAARERIWEPGELVLTTEPVSKLDDMEGKEAGSQHDCKVWNGTEFAQDDPGKYPGPQRLKLTFAVKPGTSKAWMQYYNETVGAVELPVWQLGN